MKTRVYCAECDRYDTCAEPDCYAKTQILYEVTIPAVTLEQWATSAEDAAFIVFENLLDYYDDELFNVKEAD